MKKNKKNKGENNTPIPVGAGLDDVLFKYYGNKISRIVQNKLQEVIEEKLAKRDQQAGYGISSYTMRNIHDLACVCTELSKAVSDAFVDIGISELEDELIAKENKKIKESALLQLKERL